ncbi:MAG: hypothetical protein ACXABY_18230 [Candidatus Thorarchaeota archaeon]
MTVAEKDWVTIKRYVNHQDAAADALHSFKSVRYTGDLSRAANRCERAEVLEVFIDNSVRIMLGKKVIVADLGWLEVSPSYKSGDKVRIKEYDAGLHNSRLYPRATLKIYSNVVVLEPHHHLDRWHVQGSSCWIKNCWIEGYADETGKVVIPSVSVCGCNILLGCSCGVFKAEMEAAGKVYDTNLRCYVKLR